MTASSGWTTSSPPQNLKNLLNRPTMAPRPPLVRLLSPRSTSSRSLLYSISRFCKPLCYSNNNNSSNSRRRVWAASSWPWDNLHSHRMWQWLPLLASLRHSCYRIRPPSCRGETELIPWASCTSCMCCLGVLSWLPVCARRLVLIVCWACCTGCLCAGCLVPVVSELVILCLCLGRLVFGVCVLGIWCQQPVFCMSVFWASGPVVLGIWCLCAGCLVPVVSELVMLCEFPVLRAYCVWCSGY